MFEACMISQLDTPSFNSLLLAYQMMIKNFFSSKRQIVFQVTLNYWFECENEAGIMNVAEKIKLISKHLILFQEEEKHIYKENSRLFPLP